MFGGSFNKSTEHCFSPHCGAVRSRRLRRCIDNGMAGRRIASKHRGSQMSNPTRKTNAQLVDVINQLKAQSRDTGAAVWRDVAMRLSKSRKNWAQPNLSRVSRYAPRVLQSSFLASCSAQGNCSPTTPSPPTVLATVHVRK